MLPWLQSWLETIVGSLREDWRLWLVGFVQLWLAHRLVFITIPHWAIVKFGATRPRALRRYLKWMMALPAPLGSGHKLVIRQALAARDRVEGRHEEAIAHGRAILATLALGRGNARFATLEAHTRRQLADSLEAVGQVAEADAERRLAEERLARGPVDAFQLTTRAKALERENRYAEAYDLYEQALPLIPAAQPAVRIECLAHLYLTAFNAGRPADCVRWAEEAIAQGARGTTLRGAHRMAGIAHGNLGRLDESERHIRLAYDVAVAAGDEAQMGEILGSLANIRLKLGKLEEAHADALHAATIHPKARWISRAIRAQVLKEWGRYDEALALLHHRDEEGPQFHVPASERRVQAGRALDAARIEATAGRADDAWVHIREAIAELGTDAKLGLKCDAAASWVFAVRGLPDDSRRVAEQADARLVDFEQDPSTGRGVCFDLGMAAWTRGDHADGIDCWTRYLDLGPDPVYRPTAHYSRGECHLALGDAAAARDDFRAAVAPGIDSHHARLAGVRLREVGIG